MPFCYIRLGYIPSYPKISLISHYPYTFESLSPRVTEQFGGGNISIDSCSHTISWNTDTWLHIIQYNLTLIYIYNIYDALCTVCNTIWMPRSSMNVGFICNHCSLEQLCACPLSKIILYRIHLTKLFCGRDLGKGCCERKFSLLLGLRTCLHLMGCQPVLVTQPLNSGTSCETVKQSFFRIAWFCVIGAPA